MRPPARPPTAAAAAAAARPPATSHRPTRPAPPAGDFTETTERTVRLGDIPARVLERCCQYFHFKLRHADTPSGAVPAFPIPPELVLELLMAANYLDA